MLLFVGLGNPGSRYAGNRHNIGFMVVEAIAKRHGIGPWRRRFQGVAAEGPLGGERVLLLLPGTFMNESGRAVAEAAHFYKLGARRHRGVPRRDRPRAREGAGQDRRRRRRPQRPALDHGAYRQRLSARAHRRRPSRRQGSGACLRAQRLRQGRAAVGRGACATIIADNAELLAKGQDASFQNKVHLAMQAKGFWRAERSGGLRRFASIAIGIVSERDARDIMGFKCGIVGLPNVGKSTLFNALTETAAAQAANYPFCTIEPNVGEVAVPDPRLDALATLAKSAQIVPTRLTFVDIAGLVRGASKGEGLGNQFLGQYPRGRCHRACGALLRGSRRHPCREPHRSDRRHRDHRDRADAGRSRQPGAARRRAGEEGQGQRQGRARRPRRRSISSTARSRCCATASRRAWSSASPRRRRPFTRSAC